MYTYQYMLKKPYQMLLHLLFPDLCFACKVNQNSANHTICTACRYQLIPSNFHKMRPNPVLERFWGRVEIEHATAAFVFSKDGLLQQLIHQLKYDNKPQIGYELGKIYGKIIRHTAPYKYIDIIVPVPLHPKKQHTRGYNQAAKFAEGLAESMHKEWNSHWLVRTENTETQTQKSRIDRFKNVQTAFELSAAAPPKANILLVDDVITTGATLEACTAVLLASKNYKVSLAAIALTS